MASRGYIGSAARTATGAAFCATLLGACTMAGLPGGIKPAPAQAAVASAQAASAEGAEVEEQYRTPLAFVNPSSNISSLDGMIARYAAQYDVPESLIRRVIQRESGYNPKARNGPNLGLMQIRHDTARSMGYRGDADGLLDADTNLRYAVKYLRGAYLVGGRSPDAAVRFYSRGYYYDAKRQGLLNEVGL
jgi:soluble lytic murein transglycosylase-like protein